MAWNVSHYAWRSFSGRGSPVAHPAGSNTHLAQPIVVYDPGLQVEKENERYAIILESALDKREAKKQSQNLTYRVSGIKTTSCSDGRGRIFDH